MDEQRRRANSANPVERLAAALLIPAALRRHLARLDDRQLARLLDDEVGAHLSLMAPEATICCVAVERLRRPMKMSPGRKGFWIRRRATRSWTAMRDEGTHILSTEVALYRAGIPFLQLPWQRNRFASGTFMVTDVAGARACLIRAGFRETARSATVLIDCRTRQPIRLYEDTTQLHSGNEEELTR